ncbi:hypothetical protein ACS0TY_009628 [Phlomoides rotata]
MTNTLTTAAEWYLNRLWPGITVAPDCWREREGVKILILKTFLLEMEQSDFDSITTRVRHLRENIAEFGNVQQANLDIVQTSIHGVGYAQRLLWQALERPLLKIGSPSVTHNEKGQQAEPSQGIPVKEPRQTDFAEASSSSNLEESGHQASKPDVSGQPTTSGVKEGEISLKPQKGPKRVDTNIAGVKSFWFFNNTWESLINGMEFDAAHFITDVSGKYPRLWTLKGAHQISVLPDWVCNVVQESWHNNPYLKRGDELEIKFITVAREDMTNSIQYPSFDFMKL